MPVLEVLTYSRCCSSRQSRSGERSSARARMFWSGVRPSHSTSNSSLSQTSHLFTFWCYCFEVRMARKRKRSWTADALCRLDSDCALVEDSEQDLAPPGTEGNSARTTRHFSPRSLPQEIIFAHSPYEGGYPNQRLHRNLPCRADLLCPIAATECANLLTRELARANIPIQGSARRRVGPAGTRAYRLIQLADPVPWHELWQGRQQTDSICDSEPDLWKLNLDVGGDYCNSTSTRRSPRHVHHSHARTCLSSSAPSSCFPQSKKLLTFQYQLVA